MNEKISEKAVWDELVPSEDEKTSSASFGQSAQAQMMFCYKCNQVIPANSAFCPWCQTELFVTCPKCGNKYSSQYPACNQCGTNLKVYMLEQEHLKEERIKKQRQEEERKRVEEEQRRLAEEQQRRLNVERAKHEEIQKSQLRTRFLSENLGIIKTAEFKKTEKVIDEFENYYKQQLEEINTLPIVGWVFIVMGIVTMFCIEVFDNFIVGVLFEIIYFAIAMICFASANTVTKNKHDIKIQFKKYIENQLLDKYIRVIVEASQLLLDKGLVRNNAILENKTDFVILSYRKAYNREYELYRSLIII